MIRQVDEGYMRLALQLARRKKGSTHPNPTVGAVVVKDGKIVAVGQHEGPGKPHAEAVALKRAGKEAEGSTLYVTLEPCTHHGRTPPCCELILEKGVRRVVIAVRDPNPQAGGGVEYLKEAGLEVEVGVLEEEARRLNEDFFTFVTHDRPFVTLKWAQTLDGKLATSEGKSKWITSEESRKLAHALRREATAVLVGVGTVLKDDPLLTVRLVPTERQPVRVVLDPQLRIPLDSKLVKDKSAPTWVLTATESEKTKALREEGVKIVLVKEFTLPQVLKKLKELEVVHLLVEGGAETLTAFLREGLFDRIALFMSPRFFGEGIGIGALGVKEVEDAPPLRRRRLVPLGDEVFMELGR
ncbi:MAG: bifunctional diaminohydroxyphosphoribosylaminopyrimidine deaminase/5-amino-6-(5-phosphoribosylamino)uracil reductase RibD [Aquificae bacterium]|nr:bifunctional diaminohydroxyphosphoribosylaminopyrimidine deaminase/5-amino-6-(5-phosphoribosylamino)uracil reductase RibD [Aquificota bacterium]